MIFSCTYPSGRWRAGTTTGCDFFTAAFLLGYAVAPRSFFLSMILPITSGAVLLQAFRFFFLLTSHFDLLFFFGPLMFSLVRVFFFSLIFGVWELQAASFTAFYLLGFNPEPNADL